MNRNERLRRTAGPLACMISNLILVMVLFTVCRILFILGNRSLFPEVNLSRSAYMCLAGLKFDLSAVLYTNLPYILVMLLPLAARTKGWYRVMARLLFVIPNFLALAANLVDVAYFPFTSRRMTWSVFNEFSNDDNLSKIFGEAFAQYWPLFLAGALMLVALIMLFRHPRTAAVRGWGYCLTHTLIMLCCLYPIVAGMRGGFGITVRPITLSNANQYVESPLEASIVLNTPFSMYRTISKTPFKDPRYFDDEKEMLSHFNAVHQPSADASFTPRNVCIFIVESFSASYSELLSREQGSGYEGYMPFLDSLMQESLCFRWSFANGRKSIEAMPSVLSGIPSLVEPFFLTSYSTNAVSGIAGELVRNKGYNASFFHGAPKGSMGFEAYSHITGYSGQYNRDTFADDSQFDGTWAIYDKPFIHYFKEQMDGFEEPFVSTIFTATSHHPFSIPAEYEEVFKGGTLPMYRCVQYTDMALREFFREAAGAPWYDNTVFVITGDHTSVTDRDEYRTNYGLFEIPMLIYSPSGDLKGWREGIAQQADIMPTILSYLGYDRPFVSFGCDLLTTPDEDTYAINYLNGHYQFFKGDWCLQYDGSECNGLYDFKHDRLQEHNLKDERPEVIEGMMPQLKSLIQQYMSRMVGNRLTCQEEE